MYIHIYVYTCVCCIHTCYIYVYTYIHTCYIYVYTYIHTCYIYVYTNIHTCYIYAYTDIQLWRASTCGGKEVPEVFVVDFQVRHLYVVTPPLPLYVCLVSVTLTKLKQVDVGRT